MENGSHDVVAVLGVLHHLIILSFLPCILALIFFDSTPPGNTPKESPTLPPNRVPIISTAMDSNSLCLLCTLPASGTAVATLADRSGRYTTHHPLLPAAKKKVKLSCLQFCGCACTMLFRICTWNANSVVRRELMERKLGDRRRAFPERALRGKGGGGK